MENNYKQMLRPLYEKMIEEVGLLKDFQNDKYTAVPALTKETYNTNIAQHKLMFVGRAVNGWDREFDAGDNIYNILAKIFSDDSERVFRHLENGVIDGETYSFKRSAFWKLGKELMTKFHIGYSDIIWSNLFKVGPAGSGNPGVRLIRKTASHFADIFKTEIELYKPTHIVICIANKNDKDDCWYFNLDKDQSKLFPTVIDFKNEPVIATKFKTVSLCGLANNFTKPCPKVVVTTRPERLSNEDIKNQAEEIVKAFQMLQ